MSSKPPVVIVTGCTLGGIGHALATELGRRGCIVYATARRPQSIGPIYHTVRQLPLDVTSSESIKSCVSQVIQEEGRIDILVNNAGMGCVGPLAEVPMELAKKCFDTNLFGALAVSQAVIPHMAKQRSGKIINVGSVVGFMGTPWAGIYSTSKAALHAMSDVLRLEVRPFGIQVMILAPGAIKSNIGDNNAGQLAPVMAALNVYQPWAAMIEARASLSQSPKSTPAEEFAKQSANKILDRSVPRIFMYGHMVGKIRFMLLMPRWLAERMMCKITGLLSIPVSKLGIKKD